MSSTGALRVFLSSHFLAARSQHFTFTLFHFCLFLSPGSSCIVLLTPFPFLFFLFYSPELYRLRCHKLSPLPLYRSASYLFIRLFLSGSGSFVLTLIFLFIIVSPEPFLSLLYSLVYFILFPPVFPIFLFLLFMILLVQVL